MADKSEIIVKIVGKIIFVEMTMPAVFKTYTNRKSSKIYTYKRG